MELQGIFIGVVILISLGITFAISANVISSVGNSLGEGSTSQMIANNASAGIGNMSGWLPTIGTIIASAVIIGLIVGAFVSFGGPKGKD